jgi:hypothetical protein
LFHQKVKGLIGDGKKKIVLNMANVFRHSGGRARERQDAGCCAALVQFGQ